MRYAALISMALGAGAGLAVSAGAQEAQSQQEKIRRIVVYGTDPCPPSPPGEVVVCARRPESERFRVPRALRRTPPSPESESWASRARSIERVGQTGIQSCSPVGPAGASGCLAQMIEQSRADRRRQEEEGPTP